MTLKRTEKRLKDVPGDFILHNLGALACARLSDSIRSGNVLKAKLRRARLGKGGGGSRPVSLQPPRVFRISYY